MKAPLFLCSLIAAGLCCVATPVRAQANDTATVLILAFDNATGQQELNAASKAVPDLMAAFLGAGTDRVRVVDRTVLEAIYEEKSLTWQGLLGDRSKLRSGALSQAAYIVRGSLIRKGESGDSLESIEVRAFLHETASTRLLKDFEAQGSPGQLVHLCREIASAVAAFFQVELPPIEELPLDDDPQKSLLMIHGLSAFHNGQPHRAITCFLKILDHHRDDESSKFWLAKSFVAAGLDRHAKIELEAFLEKFPESQRALVVKGLLRSIDEQ